MAYQGPPGGQPGHGGQYGGPPGGQYGGPPGGQYGGQPQGGPPGGQYGGPPGGQYGGQPGGQPQGGPPGGQYGGPPGGQYGGQPGGQPHGGPPGGQYGGPPGGQPGGQPHGGPPGGQYGGPPGGQPGGQPHGGPPGGQYGGPPGGQPPPQNDPLYGYFQQVAGQDGEVDADELQKCLTQARMSGSYKPFNLETCRLMIAMLDKDATGKLGFNEFKELGMVLNSWMQNFMSFDADRSGTVNPDELQKALTGMGYRFTPQAVNIIAKRYSSQGAIAFDDYIACCLKLRSATDMFRKRDKTQQGTATFQFDDFIQCIMSA
ncbi:sorcin-like [Hyperolius riggenbachi]|uniref:sorcin-like n=1 Tax=Hyperolius riggenbachi TaxID=752182 RepID=UPI0035A2DF6B